MDSLKCSSKLHAVCIPFPVQGHINPMMKLAKILYHRGFHITFVNTEFNHKRLLKSRGPDALNGLPCFDFETIPDGLPPTDVDATQDILSLCESIFKTCLPQFQKLIHRLNNSSSPVSFIVSDAGMSFTLDVAKQLGIPEVLFWTTSASASLGFCYYRQLMEKGYIPLKNESDLTNGYLDTVIDWMPAMEGIRLKDLPTFFRTTDPDNFLLYYAFRENERAQKVSAIILNTFDGLEHEALHALSSMLPPVYCVGPLHLVLNNHVHDVHHVDLKQLGSNLWKEEPDCLQWLDTKGRNSVVYVNFGSTTIVSRDQLFEFAWGLADSNQTFLWILRPDLVNGDSAILPLEFVTETQNRSFFASWCPQEEVLNHPSIGGFLTHCGWNSTIESISFGVPMICWPFFADQQTNCWFSCTRLGVGMEINSDVKRIEVEGLVKELMEGEKGKDMKKKALEWKKMAEEATTTRTSSSLKNLDRMINQIIGSLEPELHAS